MPVYIGRKAVAGCWWAFCLRWAVLIVFALALHVFLNWIIACSITVLIRPWQSSALWDPRNFQEWKVPWELAASACVWMLIIGYLILYSYVSTLVSARSSIHPYYFANIRLIMNLEVSDFLASLFDSRKVL